MKKITIVFAFFVLLFLSGCNNEHVEISEERFYDMCQRIVNSYSGKETNIYSIKGNVAIVLFEGDTYDISPSYSSSIQNDKKIDFKYTVSCSNKEVFTLKKNTITAIQKGEAFLYYYCGDTCLYKVTVVVLAKETYDSSQNNQELLNEFFELMNNFENTNRMTMNVDDKKIITFQQEPFYLYQKDDLGYNVIHEQQIQEEIVDGEKNLYFYESYGEDITRSLATSSKILELKEAMDSQFLFNDDLSNDFYDIFEIKKIDDKYIFRTSLFDCLNLVDSETSNQIESWQVAFGKDSFNFIVELSFKFGEQKIFMETRIIMKSAKYRYIDYENVVKLTLDISDTTFENIKKEDLANKKGN